MTTGNTYKYYNHILYMSQSLHKYKLFNKNGIGESKKANIYFACVFIFGLLSSILALSVLSEQTQILLSSILLVLVIPAAYITRQYYRNRLQSTVQDVLGFSRSGRIDDFPVRSALRYLGHNVSNYKDDVVVDGNIYVKFEWNLDYESVQNLLHTVLKDKNIESLVYVYGGGKVTYGVKRLIEDNNIIMVSENDAYDAVYEKIKSNRHEITTDGDVSKNTTCAVNNT